MWYFSWILGAGLAASFAILNGMWYELRENDRTAREAQGQEAKRLAEAARGD
jgi:cytochrome bd-I ubiquinol oxidase subunit X